MTAVRKVTASFLIFLLLISVAHVTSANPQSDWSSLKNFIGQAIAIKTTDNVTSFGSLVSVDDSEITVRLVDELQRSMKDGLCSKVGIAVGSGQYRER